MPDANHLPIGSSLEQGRIAAVLAADEAGFVYLVHDRPGGSTAVVEELLPPVLAIRTPSGVRARAASLGEGWEHAKAAFRAYARGLLEIEHPNTPAAEALFEEGGTTYVVSRAEGGTTLASILDAGTPNQARLDDLILPILDALRALHERGLLHRNVAPETILVRLDGTPALIRPAGWRSVLGRAPAAGSGSPYRAPELSDTGLSEGAWTDTYALGAVAYRCIMGHAPPAASQRRENDGLVPTRSSDYRSGVHSAVSGALELEPLLRPSSAEDFKTLWRTRAATDSAGGPPSRRSVRSRLRQLDEAGLIVPDGTSLPAQEQHVEVETPRKVPRG